MGAYFLASACTSCGFFGSKRAASARAGVACAVVLGAGGGREPIIMGEESSGGDSLNSSPARALLLSIPATRPLTPPRSSAENSRTSRHHPHPHCPRDAGLRITAPSPPMVKPGSAAT